MKLSLGPIPYYWRRDTVEAFYEAICCTPLDIIYLGETVCAKRHELRAGDWLALARALAGGYREVVLSSLTLIESNADLASVRRLCDNDGLLVEANDMAAVNRLVERGLPFYCGPAINIYNQHTLRLLARQGMKRWVMPVELGRDTLAEILAASGDLGVETEVFAHGRLPLAWSARCFTARALGRPKDDCRYACLDYPDGLALHTREAQPLFNLNGIQTQSAAHCDLLGEWQTMRDIGVDILRISPQHEGTEAVVWRYAETIAANEKPLMLIDADACNGYWFGAAGMAAVDI